MTFRNRILISIWSVVLSLLVITFFIINYWTRARMEESFARELGTASSAAAVQENLHAEQLLRACAVIAESPRLRAVAELGDRRTAEQLVSEMNQPTLSEIVVLTDRTGGMLVRHLHGANDEFDFSSVGVIGHALRGERATETRMIRNKPYRLVSVPLVIGEEIAGTLTSGFEISASDIDVLKQSMNCDVILLHQGAPALSTMDSATSFIIAGEFRSSSPATGQKAKQITFLKASGLEYLVVPVSPYRTDAGSLPTIAYLLVKPLTVEVRNAMRPILSTFGFVSLIFLALTTGIGLVISRSMTRPVSQLVKGTEEIARGNYGYAISVTGQGEFAVLASRFMQMSASLEHTISELGRLNNDLLSRNIALDATLQELRKTQEDLIRSERLAATGKMTAQLAHEVNNPIHNIKSCLDTALHRLPADSRARELISVAYDEADRLSRLTGQMLHLYRTSVIEEEFAPIDIRDLLRELHTASLSELEKVGVEIVCRVDEPLPHVSGSRDKLMQVFLNLVTNARDAMPNGGTITIVASATKELVRISVSDTGVGIPPENVPRLFDAFFTTKGNVSGVGLGLSVCHGIISRHGGAIEVTSIVGNGSTFTISLPALG
jgi:signal transduction histidine kinase